VTVGGTRKKKEPPEGGNLVNEEGTYISGEGTISKGHLQGG